MTTDLGIYKTLVKAAVMDFPETGTAQLFLVFSDGTKMFYSVESANGKLVDTALNLKFLGVHRR